MKKTGILILSLLILSAFVAGVSAKEKVIDIIHLNNGKIVTGVIIEIIPKKSIKLETIDGNIITYPSDEIKKKQIKNLKGELKEWQMYPSFSRIDIFQKHKDF